MRVISYALFGYDRARADNCFDFNSYLRGLMLCLRFNKLIYPEWKTVLQLDYATYEGFKDLFKALEDKDLLIIEKNKNGAKLCEAMLWRLKPIFMENVTHLLCRDLDSLSTYREKQAVQYWVDSNTKVMHAITDSVSHNLPLLGGMIGIRPDNFKHRLGVTVFEELMSRCTVDLSQKGSDQTFLNEVIYPYFGLKGTDSITQHYFNGYGRTFLSDWHTCICSPPAGHDEKCPNNYKIDLPDELKETNSVCGHVGSAGYYEAPTMKIIYKYRDMFKDLAEIEKPYPQIFYWNT